MTEPSDHSREPVEAQATGAEPEPAGTGPAGAKPPVVTVVMVGGLGNPDYLVEIEAIAVIPS